MARVFIQVHLNNEEEKELVQLRAHDLGFGSMSEYIRTLLMKDIPALNPVSKLDKGRGRG